MVNRDLLGLAIDAGLLYGVHMCDLDTITEGMLYPSLQYEIARRNERKVDLTRKIRTTMVDLRLATECRQNAGVIWPFQVDLNLFEIEVKRLGKELLLLRGIISPFHSFVIAVIGIDCLIGRGRVGGLA